MSYMPPNNSSNNQVNNSTSSIKEDNLNNFISTEESKEIIKPNTNSINQNRSNTFKPTPGQVVSREEFIRFAMQQQQLEQQQKANNNSSFSSIDQSQINNKSQNNTNINFENDKKTSTKEESIKEVPIKEVPAEDNQQELNKDNKADKTEINDKSRKKSTVYLEESQIDISIKQKNTILSLIFDGCTYTNIIYKSKKLRLRSIKIEESEQAYKQASNYNDQQFYVMYQLLVLSRALIEIEDYIFNNYDECLDFLYQLPYDDIVKIYDLYFEDIKRQNKIINNISYFYDLVDEPFFRMKYKVMRAFNCLPTELRCKQMNDAQWLWLYYNLEEDLFERIDETQDNLDYIGFYINSDAAKKVMKHNQQRRKQRDQKRRQRFKKIQQQYATEENKVNNAPKSASQVLDNYFSSSVDVDDNTIFNSSFEQELAKALGTTDLSKITEISDDHEAGNPFESEEDFMERVRAFAPFAGTNYGYQKPEKPKINPVTRRAAYIARPNLGTGEYIPGYDEENTIRGKSRRAILNELEANHKAQVQNTKPIANNLNNFVLKDSDVDNKFPTNINTNINPNLLQQNQSIQQFQNTSQSYKLNIKKDQKSTDKLSRLNVNDNNAIVNNNLANNNLTNNNLANNHLTNNSINSMHHSNNNITNNSPLIDKSADNHIMSEQDMRNSMKNIFADNDLTKQNNQQQSSLAQQQQQQQNQYQQQYIAHSQPTIIQNSIEPLQQSYKLNIDQTFYQRKNNQLHDNTNQNKLLNQNNKSLNLENSSHQSNLQQHKLKSILPNEFPTVPINSSLNNKLHNDISHNDINQSLERKQQNPIQNNLSANQSKSMPTNNKKVSPADLEFMRKMNIHSMSEIEQYKTMEDKNQDVDFFVDDDDE